MRVSFVLRSAEASSLGLCNSNAVNYRDITSCPLIIRDTMEPYGMVWYGIPLPSRPVPSHHMVWCGMVPLKYLSSTSQVPLKYLSGARVTMHHTLCQPSSFNYRDIHATIGTSSGDLQKAVNSVVFPGGPPAQY
jgi:hypothetical protein